jgi:hypothetical protein
MFHRCRWRKSKVKVLAGLVSSECLLHHWHLLTVALSHGGGHMGRNDDGECPSNPIIKLSVPWMNMESPSPHGFQKVPLLNTTTMEISFNLSLEGGALSHR